MKKKVEFLLVLSAGKAQMKPLGGKKYLLTMKLPNVGQVTMFSDRPQRIVKELTGEQFKKMWSGSSHSYKVNPPNAVLSAKGFRPVVVTLLGDSITGDVASYRFQSFSPVKGLKSSLLLQKVTLTIDSMPLCGNQKAC